MATPHATWSFGTILDQVRGVRRHWEAAGIRIASTRVDSYERELERLVQLWPDRLTNNLTPEQVRDIILMFAEVTEYLFVSSVVPYRRHLLAHPRLREIISGRPLSAEELNTTPRNTLFELTVACLVERSGLTADVVSGADVETMVSGIPLCIECKRIQRLEALEVRLTEADRQLQPRVLERGPDTVCIAAISVTKAFTEGTKRMEVAEDRQAVAAMAQLAFQTADAARRFWPRLAAVDSILLHACVAGSTGLPFVYTQFGFLSRPGLTAQKKNMIERLSKDFLKVRPIEAKEASAT
jgi:hypothetical protein